VRPPALAALLLAPLAAGCIDDAQGPGPLAGDPEPCIPLFGDAVGAMQSRWTRPATVGAQRSEWQPAPLPWADAGHLDRLESVTLTLEWANAPQSAADFGIALGRGGSFRYWNQEYQTSLGPQSEALALDRAALEELGWTSGDRLDAGPSVSTGAYAATPIAYELSWKATFLQPPADEACASTAAAQGSGQ
jgi:hypothetical protein